MITHFADMNDLLY